MSADKGGDATARLRGTVPFGIGVTVAPRIGDAIGDMSRGRSVSEGGVISVEGRGGG